MGRKKTACNHRDWIETGVLNVAQESGGGEGLGGGHQHRVKDDEMGREEEEKRKDLSHDDRMHLIFVLTWLDDQARANQWLVHVTWYT